MKESVYSVEEEVQKDNDAAGSSELDFSEMNRLWHRGLMLDDLIVRPRCVLERVPFRRIAVRD
jgi:hypothetical protein